jgi:molybdopterin-biosynthesis enzyme MoeA-like protein
MFSFGGIGSTPDDLTRSLSADIFTNSIMKRNKRFEQDIIDRIGDRAYPHPIKMSDLPLDAKLLNNPVNNMSGYYLQNQYFFMPGFPEMAQPMMIEIINDFLPKSKTIYTKSFIADTGEGILIELMKNVPQDIELSSLPMMNGGNPKVEFALSYFDEELLTTEFKKFTDFLNLEDISYRLL